jgi:uncharacterized membrane protein
MCKLLKNIEEFKKDYDILSINDICKKHGIKNPKTIWAYAKKLNINRPKGTKRKYQVNDDYFAKHLTVAEFKNQFVPLKGWATQ